MKFDKEEKLLRSVIHHGPNNNRVYLMKLHPEDDAQLTIDRIINLSSQMGYTKIFAKVPETVVEIFVNNGFCMEAEVPGFYKGLKSGVFLGKYLDKDRGILNEETKTRIEEIKQISVNAERPLIGDNNYVIKELTDEDIPEMVSIYKEVFSVYPFPIFDEEYIRETMMSNLRYFGAEIDGKLVGISSAEIDQVSSNAEMTDFATLPVFRGKQLAYLLLKNMMGEMREQGIKTIYTIARATSVGMNKTFGRLGFKFGGTLINNTQIGASIESMNVWYYNFDIKSE